MTWWLASLMFGTGTAFGFVAAIILQIERTWENSEDPHDGI